MEIIKFFFITGFCCILINCSFYPTEWGESTESLINDATTLMSQKKWKQALKYFTKALISDPKNEKAIIGYSITNLACTATAPEIIKLMKNLLGLKNYPIKPWQVFSLSSWYQIINKEIIVYYKNTNPKTQLIPKFENLTVLKNMGMNYFFNYLDNFLNRSIIFAINYKIYNARYTMSIQDTSQSFSKKLDQINTILKKVKNTTSFKLSTDMFSDEKPAHDTNIQIKSDNEKIKEIIIGKAEVLIIASILKSYVSILYLAQAYKHSIPLTQFQNANNTFKKLSLQNLYEIILKQQTNLRVKNNYSKAINSWSTALSWTIKAINKITQNRPGFSISTDPCVGLISIKNWKIIIQNLEDQKQFYNKINTSVKKGGLQSLFNI